MNRQKRNEPAKAIPTIPREDLNLLERPVAKDRPARVRDVGTAQDMTVEVPQHPLERAPTRDPPLRKGILSRGDGTAQG